MKRVLRRAAIAAGSLVLLAFAGIFGASAYYSSERGQGCASCHEPHGSVNPRMLARQEVRFLCLECHAALPSAPSTNSALGVVPPAFHDLRSPRYQNCTVCHQKIHGSYVDRDLLR